MVRLLHGENAMRDVQKQKVYSAVQECLAVCYGKSNPLTHASEYVQRLRGRRDWCDREVEEVESLVLRAVRVIVRHAPPDCCQGTRRS
jgi:hypothetical protein